MRDMFSFILVAYLVIVVGTVSSDTDSGAQIDTSIPSPLSAAELDYVEETEGEDTSSEGEAEADYPISTALHQTPETQDTADGIPRTDSIPAEKQPEVTDPETEETGLFLPESRNSNETVVSEEQPGFANSSETNTNSTAEVAKGNPVPEALRVLAKLEKNIIDVLDNSLGNGSIGVLAAASNGVHNTYSYQPHPNPPPPPYRSTGHHREESHYHYYEPTTVKPLKPSVVHRDPHAHFDHYDAIRTQDHDRHHQHRRPAHVSHVIGGAEHGHGMYEHSEYGTSHGYGHGGSHGHFQPYHYETHKVPECAHENRRHYNLTFCLEDHYYPTETIEWAIRQSSHSAQRLLSDVTYQSADNLVDGLTRAEEEGYTYDHYYGATHQQHHQLDRYKPPYTGYSYSEEYYKKGGYICPSNIFYARPRRAMNTYGKWKVIVNLDYVHTQGHGNGLGSPVVHGHGHSTHHHQTHTQTLRLEQCIYPNAPCSYIDSHYHSRCLQKHNFVRLVAWTHESGLHIDTFKMPIACSCHVQQPAHYYAPAPPPQPHHSHSTVHNPHPHPHPTPAPYGPRPKVKDHGQVIASLHQGKTNLLTSFLG